MGIHDRKEREKESRRNMIVDAAEQLFFSKGVHATTMDDIAELSELSKGTLYLYFKNKEELYAAILIRGMRLLNSMIKEAVDTDACGLNKVFLMGKKLLEFSERYPRYFEAVFFHSLVFGSCHLENKPMDKEINDIGDELISLAADTLILGIRDGSIRDDIDVLRTAFSLESLIIGLIRMVNLEKKHLLEYHGLEANDLMDYSFDLIKHALQSSDHSVGPKTSRLSGHQKNAAGGQKRKPRSRPAKEKDE